MLKLDLKNSQVNIFSPELKEKVREIQKKNVPEHTKFYPDFKRMNKIAEEAQHFNNIIIAGRGGSITSFEAMFMNLAAFTCPKKIFLLKSNNPDLVKHVKQVCPVNESLFLCISKSGNTVEVLENLMAFQRYPTIILTKKSESTLKKIAEETKATFLPLPAISGRFSAGTCAALLPAKLVGIKAEEVEEGLADGFEKFAPQKPLKENLALQAALALFELEEKGFTEIFMPVYSPKLIGFSELITQLIHETTGKEGKGQTILVMEAPEAQHHTNQRFFDGRKNMLGFFLRLENFEDMEAKTVVPQHLKAIALRQAKLEVLDGIPLHKTIDFEFQGTFQDAVEKKIPFISLSLEKITPYNIGQLIAFFQYLAIYSAWLRNLNPFDQPAVEASKKISFELRKNFKG